MMLRCLILFVLSIFEIHGMDSKAPLYTRPTKILRVQEMYLTRQQRSLHKRDLEAAQVYSNVVDPSKYDIIQFERSEELENTINIHCAGEEIIEEAFQLPMFESVEQAQEALKLTEAGLKLINEKRAKILDGQRRLEAIIADIQENMNVLNAKNTKESLFYANKEYENYCECMSMRLQNEEHLKILETDPIERAKFIRKNPKLFVEKKYSMRNRFGFIHPDDTRASGQIITLIDEFDDEVPESLKEKCHNLNDFGKGKFPKPSSTLSHGFSTANVAVNFGIGIAREAKFHAIHFNDIWKQEYVIAKDEPPSNFPIIEYDIDNFDMSDLRRLETLHMNGDLKFYIKVENRYLFCDFSESIPAIPGLIVNLSFSYGDNIDTRSMTTVLNWAKSRTKEAFLMIELMKQGKLVVHAAGNESTYLSSSHAYAVFKTFAQAYPRSFIVALALSPDLNTMSHFGNQPGDHLVQNVCLTALGYWKGLACSNNQVADFIGGTSFSAPFVCAIAAILASNFPEATATDISTALLENATPVVMKKNSSRLYRIPYSLHNVKSKSIKPTVYQYFKKDGERKKNMKVEQWMIRDGRKKYGMGIINIAQAFDALAEKFSS